MATPLKLRTHVFSRLWWALAFWMCQVFVTDALTLGEVDRLVPHPAACGERGHGRLGIAAEDAVHGQRRAERLVQGVGATVGQHHGSGGTAAITGHDHRHVLDRQSPRWGFRPPLLGATAGRDGRLSPSPRAFAASL